MTHFLKTALFAAGAIAISSAVSAATFDTIESVSFGGVTETLGNGNNTIESGETFNYTSVVGSVDALFAADVSMGDAIDFDLTFAANAAPLFSTVIGALTFTATEVFAPAVLGASGISLYVLGEVTGSFGTEAASLIFSSNTGEVDQLATISLSVPPAPTNVIPLPAGAPLLIGALCALAYLRRKSA